MGFGGASHQGSPRKRWQLLFTGELEEQKAHPFPFSGRGFPETASPGRYAGGWGVPGESPGEMRLPTSTKNNPRPQCQRTKQEGWNQVLL